MNLCKSNNTASGRAPGSVLVIEDSALFNNALCKGLKALGHTIFSAFTLSDALAVLDSNSFDLVVLDLHLPDGEGEELFESLNEKQKLKIIVYTSDVDKQRRDEWFRHGVLGYLSKDDPLSFVLDEIDKTLSAIQENTNYNILVIDDSSVVRRQVTRLLQPRNYNVLVAEDGTKALDIISQSSFDLILLDFELPDMNGDEILKLLKQNESTSSIPIFIMTGRYDAKTVGNLIKQGAANFS